KLVKTTDLDEPGLTLKTKKNHGKGGKQAKRVKKMLNGDTYSYYYALPQSSVKRFHDTYVENIIIDLTKSEFDTPIESGDLYITLIDGIGLEHLKEYNLQ